MKSHEGYEEGKLYPYLHARFGVRMQVLVEQHEDLGVAEERVRAAYRNGNSLEAAHAFKKHDEILVPHLALEEQMVIPLLLDMSAEEFDRYSQSSIASLLRYVADERSHASEVL